MSLIIPGAKYYMLGDLQVFSIDNWIDIEADITKATVPTLRRIATYLKIPFNPRTLKADLMAKITHHITGEGVEEKGQPTVEVKDRKKHYPVKEVLRQVHPDTGITKDALEKMEKILEDIQVRIMRPSIPEMDLALTQLLPGSLLKHAKSEGTKAVVKFNQATQNQHNNVPSVDYGWLNGGLLFNAEKHTSKKIQGADAVYLSAVLEYLTAEIMELSGNATRDNKRVRITPKDMDAVIANDLEIADMMNRLNQKPEDMKEEKGEKKEDKKVVKQEKKIIVKEVDTEDEDDPLMTVSSDPEEPQEPKQPVKKQEKKPKTLEKPKEQVEPKAPENTDWEKNKRKIIKKSK